MIAIIDYGAGNVGNVRRALTRIKRESIIVDSVDDPCLALVQGIILPGVGSFPPAMGNLVARGWNLFLSKWVDDDRPLLGICLGMQLLCEESKEGGKTRGLGIFNGIVERIPGQVKLPHTGWNTVDWSDEKFCREILVEKGPCFYFVHSFALPVCSETAATTYLDGTTFTSIAIKGRTVGFQFHPERSGSVGLGVLSRTLKNMGV